MAANQSGSPDPNDCASEPIHVPSAIQPHGCLLTLRAYDLTVVQASENVEVELGAPLSQVLGRPLSDLLSAAQCDAIRSALGRAELTAHNPLPTSVRGRDFDALLSRSGEWVVLELEPVANAISASDTAVRAALLALSRARSSDELCAAAADAVKEFTGFERVLIYRFDEQGHGSVVAERVDAGFPQYLGLRYPASDIPAQARALYLRNWLRIIPNASYVPVRLLPPLLPEAGRPLDMSDCALRSVSPIHLEYMANMGHAASMSISIIVGQKLWGLISCAQHSAPRYVRAQTRSACELLGRIFSLQLEALEALELRAFRESRMATLNELEAAMRESQGETLFALLTRATELLGFVRASGAAVVVGDRWAAVGVHPGEAVARRLSDWLCSTAPTGLFATASVRAHHPEAAVAKEVASGLLALTLPGEVVRTLLWFRPQEAQVVHWAGEPAKSLAADGGGRLHPRRSFELWRETVEGCSAPWHAGELELAQQLRRRAIEIDLGIQVEREQKAVRARDDLVAVVSHDLKNPLGAVQMQTSLLLRGLGGSEEASRRLRASAERIQRAVDRMTALIQDLLDLAKIEAGRFEVHGSAQPPAEIVDDALMVMQPLADQRSIALRVDVQPTPPVVADRDRIYQVLANLISNAIKFAAEGGTVRLCVESGQGEVIFTVIDDGPGIPDEQLVHLFDRYWQARRTARKGTGLGLYIARGIVEAHRGRIWVESRVGQGSKFHFSLPTWH